MEPLAVVADPRINKLCVVNAADVLRTLGNTAPTPAQEFCETRSFVLSFVRETTSGYEFGARPVLKRFPTSQQICKSLASETRSRRRFSGVSSCKPT